MLPEGTNICVQSHACIMPCDSLQFLLSDYSVNHYWFHPYWPTGLDIAKLIQSWLLFFTYDTMRNNWECSSFFGTHVSLAIISIVIDGILLYPWAIAKTFIWQSYTVLHRTQWRSLLFVEISAMGTMDLPTCDWSAMSFGTTTIANSSNAMTVAWANFVHGWYCW